MHNVNQIVKALVNGDVNGARDLAIAADRDWTMNINLYAAEMMPLVTTGNLFSIEDLISYHVSSNFEVDDMFMDHFELITMPLQAREIDMSMYYFKNWLKVNVKSAAVREYITWTMIVFQSHIASHGGNIEKLHNHDLQNDLVSNRKSMLALMYSVAVRDEIAPIIRKNI